MKKLLLLLAAAACLEAGTVRLANNTSFKLRTVIRAADGTYLGEVVVNPQQTMSWNDYFGGIGTYNNSQTPYTVIWYCIDGSDFSVCEQVPTGATVTPLNCEGTRTCKVKPPPGRPPLQGPSTKEYLMEPEQQQEQQEAGPPEGYTTP